ncbi:MAG TPA: SLATT domain-containing protein [Acidimicrobiales bacterium]|nr:SLATT domain-containing protein [Acidimicrobiales bacterium]
MDATDAGDGAATGEVTPLASAAAGWDANTERLLADWRNRAAAAATAHYRLAYRCRRRNVALGVPVVVFSTVVGTSLFATLNETSVDSDVRLAIGVVSVAAAVLASLQTFLRFAERAERHVIAADWYSAVRRGIDEALALPPAARKAPAEYLPTVRKEMSKIGQQAPEIPAPIWGRLAAEHGVDEGPPVRTRAPGSPEA